MKTIILALVLGTVVALGTNPQAVLEVVKVIFIGIGLPV